MCGWYQDPSDTFDWTKQSGHTPTLYTGPDCDHTNCKNGTLFLYPVGGWSAFVMSTCGLYALNFTNNTEIV